VRTREVRNRHLLATACGEKHQRTEAQCTLRYATVRDKRF
jgi:hypothetical protein